MRIVSLGHALFAATILVLGIWGLAEGQLSAVWQPSPKDTGLREALAYGCGLVCLVSGAGMPWRRTAAPAAGLLLAALLAWIAVFKAPTIFRAPGVVVSWEDCAETVVVTAGAWALYAALAKGWLAAGDVGVRIARILYGLGMVVFGVAHFAYAKETASLVPHWLPAHLAFAYGTGGAYVAAGLAVLSGVLAPLAARLSAAQMGLFTLLVWVPAVAGGSKDPFTWSETVISWVLTVAGWLVAESYRAGKART